MSGNYIVVFKEGTTDAVIDAAIESVKQQGGQVNHRYDSVLLGFSATLPDSVLGTLATHDNVDFVEADGEVSIYGQSVVKK